MKKYSKLMAILLVFAMILPGVAQAAPVVEAEEVNSNVIRLSGADRIKTSVKVSQTAYKDGAESVVIVGYEGEVDALAGTLLAHAKKGPVLFTKKGKLSEDTKTEIARLGAKNVYILGGTASIEDAVKTELETLKYTVKRISGSNREGTAAAVAKEVGGKTTHVFLARGYGDLRAVLSDALAVGPASAKGNMAVLLTRTDKVPAATLKSMKDLGVTNVTIVGGEGAVNSGVKTELETLKYTVDRLSGTTREGTAIAIANKYFAGKANALVANGYGSPDALIGGYLGAAIDAPILFSQANKVSEVTTDYLKANTEKAWILGGEEVVNKEVLNKVLEAVDVKVKESITVESVSAIKQTIAAGKDVDLKFEVNGKEVTKAEFDETYGEEDYTVKFLYNFDASKDNRAGKVNEEVGTFKYAVQVYLDGEEVNEVEAKDFVDVKVVDAEEAVSIEKVVLDNERDYLTTDETGIGFEVTEAKNALGEDLDEDSLEALSGELKKVVSDDVTVAYVDGTTITARKAGKVTFTLTYYEDDKAIEVKLPVEVKKPGVATTVEAENQKVAAGTNVTELDFKVFDQHGLEIGSGYDVKVKDVDGKDADLSKKGIYTVEILDNAEKPEVIGSFTVTVVDVDNVDYDEFFFEDIKDDKGKEIVLDINVDTTKQNLTKTLNLKGKKDGVTVVAKDVSKDKGYDFDFDKEVFSDVSIVDGLVTVKVDITKLKEATTSTIKLTHTQGDLVQELAEIELEVVNTTPQIENLALAEGVEVLEVHYDDDSKKWIIEDLTQLTSTDVKDEDGKLVYLDDEMIEEVVFSANDGKAIVTIKDIYGGKEFVFDAAVLEDITVASANDSGIKISEAYSGVAATFTLGGADIGNVKSVKVELFDDENNLLATNTLRSSKFPVSVGGLTAPIVAIEGTYAYGSWEKTVWTEGNPDSDTLPSYVKMTLTAENGLTYSAEEHNLHTEYSGGKNWANLWD